MEACLQVEPELVKTEPSVDALLKLAYEEAIVVHQLLDRRGKGLVDKTATTDVENRACE